LRSFVAFSLAAIVTLSVAAIACGGAAPSDLLIPLATTATADEDSSAPSDATTTGSPESSTPAPESGAGDDTSVGPTEAGPADAMPIEAAPEAAASPGLPCTNGTMKVYCQGADTCCITAGLVSTTAACGAADTCLGSDLRCAASADCPAMQVCCATETAGFTTTYSASCATTCSGLTKTQLCDPGDGPNGRCPSGDTCSASTALPGYSQCR
jgi:hypothetical protein